MADKYIFHFSPIATVLCFPFFVLFPFSFLLITFIQLFRAESKRDVFCFHWHSVSHADMITGNSSMFSQPVNWLFHSRRIRDHRSIYLSKGIQIQVLHFPYTVLSMWNVRVYRYVSCSECCYGEHFLLDSPFSSENTEKRRAKVREKTEKKRKNYCIFMWCLVMWKNYSISKICFIKYDVYEKVRVS